MEGARVVIALLLVFSSLQVHVCGSRIYTFGNLWGGNIRVPAFPFGSVELTANITVYSGEVVELRLYCSDEIIVTLQVGSRSSRKFLSNNETLSVIAVENATNITIRLLNSKSHEIIVYANSTIRIYREEKGGEVLLSREQAGILGIALFIVPILIMLYRSLTREQKGNVDELLEFIGAEA